MPANLSSLFDRSLAKFLVVGGITTSVDFIIYTILGLWFNPAPAKLLSILCSTLLAFFLNKNWTFRVNDQPLIYALLKFYLAQAANIITNVAVNTWLLWLTEQRIVAFVGATGIAMWVNYLLQRLFVFRKKSKEGALE